MIKKIVFLVTGVFLSIVTACDKFGSADYSDLMRNLYKGNRDSAIIVWKHRHCEDSLAWMYATELIENKITPDSLYENLLSENCKKKWIYMSIPIFYIYFFQNRINAERSINSIASFLSTPVSRRNCGVDVENVLYIDLSDFIVSSSCEKDNGLGYERMIRLLLNGSKNTAYQLLQNEHCGDSIAWELANNLIKKRISPQDALRWIIKDNCEKRWWYTEIPVLYYFFTEKRGRDEDFSTYLRWTTASFCDENPDFVIHQLLH
jgi:hypothetical protein